MIIRRYIYREIVFWFVVTAGVICLVYAGNKCIQYLEDIAAGKMVADLLFELLGLKLVSILPRLLPGIILLALVLTFARLNADHELVIMSLAGIGRAKQVHIVLWFVSPVCLVVCLMAFYLSPWAEYRMLVLWTQAKWETAIASVAVGRFKTFGDDNKVVYVESLSADKQSMKNVFLHRRKAKKSDVSISKQALLETKPDSGARYIKFLDGKLYTGTPGQPDYQITEYESYSILLAADDTMPDFDQQTKATPIASLLASDARQHQAELQWRIALPLSCLLLTVFAVLLSQTTIGQSRYLLIFTALLTYFMYSNLLGVAKTLLARGEITPVLGLWWVHAIFLVIILSMYFQPPLSRSIKAYLRRI